MKVFVTVCVSKNRNRDKELAEAIHCAYHKKIEMAEARQFAPHKKIMSSVERYGDSENRMEANKKMFDESLYTDFEIHLNGEEIKVHKSILASRSAKFHQMFKRNRRNFVKIKLFDDKIIIEMIRFIYSNEIDNLGIIAGKLALAAEAFEIDDLKRICIESLGRTLKPHTSVETFIVADKINDIGLRNQCRILCRKYVLYAIKLSPEPSPYCLPESFSVALFSESTV